MLKKTSIEIDIFMDLNAKGIFLYNPQPAPCGSTNLW